jgi:hypothetical protein
VEVFFPGVGWVEFEPTPGFIDTAALGGAVVRRWVWQDLAASLGEGLGRLVAGFPLLAAVSEAGGRAARAAAWGLLGLGGIAVAAAWRLVNGRRRGSSAAPRTRLAGVYAEMCGLLARHGFARATSETVSEHRRRVEAAHAIPEVGAVAALVEAAAYGGRDADDGDVRAARRHVAALRLRLRRGGDLA